jgi:hypothetical protein
MVGAVQTLTEQKVGLNGQLDVAYLLQTVAAPAQISVLTLQLAASYQAWDDAWRIHLWTAGAWSDITSAILSQNGAYPVPDPSACVDPDGVIRVRFTDSAAVRRERLDTLTLDTLYATVSTGQRPNQPPTAVDDNASTLLDTAVEIHLLANDSDPDGDAIFVSELPAFSDQGGTITDLGNGTISYTPPPGFIGADTFGYSISDGELTDTATVTVTVNSAPGVSTVHVADIAMSLSAAGKNWKATATVTIVNQDNAPAISATVYGDWLFDGALLQANATAVTDASGVAVFTAVLILERGWLLTPSLSPRPGCISMEKARGEGGRRPGEGSSNPIMSIAGKGSFLSSSGH